MQRPHQPPKASNLYGIDQGGFQASKMNQFQTNSSVGNNKIFF